jgi:hypothetical protein
MPIRPIDLQTMLMQLHQVGREQAAEKEGAALQASMQGAVAKRKEIEASGAVKRPESPKEGARAVAEKKSGTSGSEEEGEGAEEESKEEDRREEIVRDPDLGNKVDLSG